MPCRFAAGGQRRLGATDASETRAADDADPRAGAWRHRHPSARIPCGGDPPIARLSAIGRMLPVLVSVSEPTDSARRPRTSRARRPGDDRFHPRARSRPLARTRTPRCRRARRARGFVRARWPSRSANATARLTNSRSAPPPARREHTRCASRGSLAGCAVRGAGCTALVRSAPRARVAVLARQRRSSEVRRAAAHALAACPWPPAS